MEHKEDRIVVAGRVEIDTRPPFKSVSEAVMLFGERVLAGGVIANKLKEIQAVDETIAEVASSQMAALKAELEEAKKDLQTVRKENKTLTQCIESLRLELGETRMELIRLEQSQAHDIQKHALLEPEIEDVKFVENLTRVEIVKKHIDEEEEEEDDDDDDEAEGFLFHREKKNKKKKKLVKFASSPALARVIVSEEEQEGDSNSAIERNPSLKKKGGGKKPLVGLMGWFLPKKKGSRSEDEC